MNDLTWHHLDLEEESPQLIDSRRRITLLVAVFIIAWLIIFIRAIQMEWRHGDAFRAEALKPLRREIDVPAVRGKLLDRNGEVLAIDRQLAALTMHYRYFQQTLDE